MLLIGDSGAGKTGALASLPEAGYHLRIIDVDNGIDVLKNLLTDEKSDYVKRYPKAAENVDYVTITDTLKNVGGKLIPAKATVWERVVGMLDNWVDGETKLGPITTWGNDTILVIDSLTMLSQAALARVLAMNGRLGSHPTQQDWGVAQGLVEGLLQMLFDDGVKCNVIVLCHITFIETDGGPTKGYPNSLGKALPPKVGRYFNTALMARSMGQGTAIKRKILTNTAGVVELKNTAPMRVENEYPLETGLAQYFEAVRGKIVAQGTTPAVVGATK